MKVLAVIKNIPFLFWMWRHGINHKVIEQWVKEYLGTLPLSSKLTRQQFFLGFIGRYGVGKTTVAKRIIERLPFVMISSDEARRFLQLRGVSSAIVGREKLIFFMGLKVIEELLQRQVNILLDADLRQSHFREALKNKVMSQGYKFLLIHVVAKDGIVWKRIAKRRLDEKSEYLYKNMERHFLARKRIHETEVMPLDIFYTFNNDEDIEVQVDDFVVKFREIYGAQSALRRQS